MTTHNSQPQGQTLTLTASLPSARHTQLLNILSGVCGMPPQPLCERHMLFRPARRMAQVDAKDAVGGSQDVMVKKRTAAGVGATVELWSLRLVGVVANSNSGNDEALGNGVDGLGDDDGFEKQREVPCAEEQVRDGAWEIQWHDLPDAGGAGSGAGNTGMNTRRVGKMVVEGGDAVGVVEGMGYQFQNQYILAGHRFTRQHTCITLYQTLVPSPSHPSSRKPRTSPLPAETQLATCLEEALMREDLTPLDRSGAYVLETKVEVKDGKKPDLVQRGAKELLGLKEILKGVVQLKGLERLVFDTRVR